MEQNRKEAYYRLQINTDNGGAMVHNFSTYSDDDAHLIAMIFYVKEHYRFGYVLFKYDRKDTCGAYHFIGKYEESTAIG